MSDIERKVLDEVRQHFDPAAEQPVEVIERTLVYQLSLFSATLRECGRALRDSLPGPLRRRLGGQA